MWYEGIACLAKSQQVLSKTTIHHFSPLETEQCGNAAYVFEDCMPLPYTSCLQGIRSQLYRGSEEKFEYYMWVLEEVDLADLQSSIHLVSTSSRQL
jgi:hypothetical protein